MAPARADDAALSPADRLERANVCLVALDLECALAELEAVEAVQGVLEPTAKKRLTELRARLALSTARWDQAGRYLDELLELDPAFEVPAHAWPERWRQALAEARERRRERDPPRVRALQLPASAPEGEPLRIRAEAEDASGVERVAVVVAGGAGRPEVTVAMSLEADGRWAATLPGDLLRGEALSLRLEAWDVHGTGPGRDGDAERPLRIALIAPTVEEEPGIAERWWFWTLVGVAAAGAATAIVLATQPEGSDAVVKVQIQ